MRTWIIVKKSLKEQCRQPWILILTLVMAPFFIGVYYVIIEASKTSYNLVVINNDKGIRVGNRVVNYGQMVTTLAKEQAKQTSFPLNITEGKDREEGLQKIKKGNGDVLVLFPEDFSENIAAYAKANDTPSVEVEIYGDLTNLSYVISAVWTHEVLEYYISQTAGKARPLRIREHAVGRSGNLDDFNYAVPGLLILSVVMLMFTATIAFVREVEQKTMIRLKLTKITGLEYLAGVSIVQLLVGVVAILLALGMAVLTGFNFHTSILTLLLVAVLTSISVIAFSMIVAAITKTTNEVLIIGNFPLFLFMFFTGVAFPIHGKALFTILGYEITLPGLMSPYHAVNALRKVMIMNLGLRDVIPEIIALITLTVLYFVIGIWAFRKRHMQLS